LRKVLVVAQFTVTLIILICTVILTAQLQYTTKKDLGYDRSQIIEFMPDLFQGDWEQNFKNFALWRKELQKIPEFIQLAPTDNSLVNISSYGGNLSWEGKDPNLPSSIYKLSANHQLKELFDLELVAGRWFSPDNSLDKYNIILNEAAVRQFSLSEPIIGKEIAWNGKGEIIGLVKDFHFKSLHHKIAPLIIFQANEDKYLTLLAKVAENDVSVALEKAQKAFESIFLEVPFHYSFMDESYAKLYQSEFKLSQLFQLFSILLIGISCLGLFGLATFSVQRRTKEIGIRKILGASVPQIVQLLSANFLKLVGISSCWQVQ